MSRKFYAASNSHGTNFTYGSDGWSVHVFDSQAARDAWVNADKYPNGNPTRETVDLKTAKRIQPDQTEWFKEFGIEVYWTGTEWAREDKG